MDKLKKKNVYFHVLLSHLDIGCARVFQALLFLFSEYARVIEDPADGGAMEPMNPILMQ